MEPSMFRLVLSVLVATLASTSISAARPSTLSMSCGQAAATVAKAGAIVLSTGEFTYDRFVATNAFCLPGEVTEAGVAPTLDSRFCQIGYVCRQRDRFEDNNN
jgi:hypothetical protein